MQRKILNLAVISALGFSQYAQAGWVTVPSTGFTDSAYTNCYNAGRTSTAARGNFGSLALVAQQYPSNGVVDTCWTNAPATEASLPPASRSGAAFTGFTQTGSTSRAIPNPVSGGMVIGNVYEKYWRNPTTNTCLIATRVIMSAVDSDAAVGTQYFKVNDLVRSGFSGAGDV